MSSALLAVLGWEYSGEQSVTSLHSHSLVGSVHDCTSPTFPIAWSRRRCTVILAVPSGKYGSNTLAEGRVPIAVSIGAGM